MSFIHVSSNAISSGVEPVAKFLPLRSQLGWSIDLYHEDFQYLCEVPLVYPVSTRCRHQGQLSYVMTFKVGQTLRAGILKK